MTSLSEVDMLLTQDGHETSGPQQWTVETSTVANFTMDSEDTLIGEPQSGEPHDPVLFLFIFYTVFMGPVCITGFIGNTVSILVLSKDRHNRVVTFLLRFLAVADNMVLTVSFVTLSVIYGLLYYVNGMPLLIATRPYIVKYVHPFAYIAQTLTIWLTVLLAINRYIAICRPFDAHKFCTKRIATIQVLVVIVLTIIINFPRFFQYNMTTVTYGNTTFLTVEDHETIGESTLFGMIFTNGLFTVLILVLPLILLLVVNTKLILELKNMRKRLSRNSGTDTSGDGERNITMVMVIIIVVLLVCHTPDRVAQLLRVAVSDENKHYPKFTFIFTNVANFCIVLNSSSNFFIYYFLRQRFRHILKAYFNIRCKQKSSLTDEEKRWSIQSTPLTEDQIVKKVVDNGAQIKMIANGKGI